MDWRNQRLRYQRDRLVVEAFESQLLRPGFDPRLGQTEYFKLGTLVAASLNASIMRLVPRLVNPVSVCFDWVGDSSCATLVFPVWQHGFNCLNSTASI